MYLIAENLSSQTPTIEDLNAYAIEHDIGYPLLVDYNWQIQSRFETNGSMPSFHLFAPGPTLKMKDEFDIPQSEIEKYLD